MLAEDAWLFASPEYDATIVWVPTSLKDVLNAADPALNVAVPRVVEPEVNITLPVGTGPLLVTFTVSVALCPAKLGLREDVTVVDETA